MTPGQTRVFALLGNPVAHSLSPAMHTAAFRALGIDATYVAIPVTTDELEPMMRALVRTGGGGNLTVPHKRAGARWVRHPDGSPLRSCNTFWGGTSNQLAGAETDSEGIRQAWQQLGSPKGSWLLIGTGGSALAAARAAAGIGARVQIHSRSSDRARAFEAELQALGIETGDGPAPPGVVVNCTPLGLKPDDPLPLAVARVPPSAAAIDLVYRPGGTGWTRALAARGVRVVDGQPVLVGQGAAAFSCWFPDLEPPIEVMRAAVARALG
jgi:shikimate dehydrogenase